MIIIHGQGENRVLRPTEICLAHRRGVSIEDLARATGRSEEEVILICDTAIEDEGNVMDPTVEGRTRQYVSQHESDYHKPVESFREVISWMGIAVICGAFIALVIVWAFRG